MADAQLINQVFRQLCDCAPRRLRLHRHVFHVTLANEAAVDAGGPYNEVITSLVEDLFSPNLELFILSPNGRARQGDHTDRYVPHPKCVERLCVVFSE